MRLTTLAVLMILAVSIRAEATEHEASAHTLDGTRKETGTPLQTPLELKDGSLLFISESGKMRMTDKDGNPMRMKEGVEMELKDGTVIMMKNAKGWLHLHRKSMK